MNNKFQYAIILNCYHEPMDWNEDMNKYVGRTMKIYKGGFYPDDGFDFHIIADSQDENSCRGKWFFKKEWIKIIERKKFIEIKE